MEAAVAFVIPLNRSSRDASSRKLERRCCSTDREEIYRLFLESDGTTVEEKSETFCRCLWNNPNLRSKCDRQLVLFSKLGHLLTPSPISWIISNDAVLQWFPQSVATLWLILTPYIRERRKRAGKWWAKPFSDFTAASVEFLLGQGVETLEMFHPKRSDQPSLKIGKEQLEKIKRQIRGMP